MIGYGIDHSIRLVYTDSHHGFQQVQAQGRFLYPLRFWTVSAARYYLWRCGRRSLKVIAVYSTSVCNPHRSIVSDRILASLSLAIPGPKAKSKCSCLIFETSIQHSRASPLRPCVPSDLSTVQAATAQEVIEISSEARGRFRKHVRFCFEPDGEGRANSMRSWNIFAF